MVFIFLFSSVTGAIVAPFTRNHWLPALIALPNIVFAVASLEPLYLLAFLIIPLSSTLLSGAVVIYLINKFLAWLSEN
jgi:fructose-specific phosphotransferase system IIC component